MKTISNPRLNWRVMLFTIALILPNFSFAQAFPFGHGPGIRFRTVDWQSTIPNYPMMIQKTSNYAPGSYQDQDDSGEDWWFDVKNIKEQGKHTGYIMAGYTHFPGYAFNAVSTPGYKGIALNDNCWDVNRGDCGNREIVGFAESPILGTLARYDLNGKKVWEVNYSESHDGYLGVIQDDDGNFITVGNTDEIVDVNGKAILYNPTAPGIGTDLTILNIPATQCTGVPPKLNPRTPFIKKIIVTKIDANGKLLWQYMYGYDDIITNTSAAIGYGGFGLDIVETKDKLGYMVMGSGNTSLDATKSTYQVELFKIAKNGTLSARQAYGDISHDYYGRKINTDGNDNYVVTGADLGSYGFYMSVDQNLTLNPNWNGGTIMRFNDLPATNVTVGEDCIFDTNGDIWVSAIANCPTCYFSGVNTGELLLFHLSGKNGGLVPVPSPQKPGGPVNVVDVTHLTAYDIKVGMCNTSDGNFALVSTIRTGNNPDPDPANNPSLKNILDSFNQNQMQQAGYCQNTKDPLTHGFGFGTWNTDAYIAKYKIDGNKLWATSFDVNDQAPDYWPGDFKKQECLYNITESDKGEVVVVGNTSNNVDDYYVASVYNDCQIQASYSITPDVSSTDNTFTIGGTKGNQNITWNTPQTVIGTISIETGSSLTINNTKIQFADSRQTDNIYTRIIVKPGAVLTINNSTLTSLASCDSSFWQGIEVWGDPSKPQSFYAGTSLVQGTVIVNNSTINRAIKGITTTATAAPDVINWTNSGGGIVQLTGATFTNNATAVEFSSYRATANGVPVNDAGFIRNCNFITDDNFGDVYTGDKGISSPYAFISLWDIHNVELSGNNFSNLYSDARMRTMREPGGVTPGIGVVSVDAEYTLNPSCNIIPTPGTPCPVANQTGNTFNNLFIGVKVVDGVNNSAFKVNRATFNNNRYGVRLEGGQYGNIVNSTFNIQSLPYYIDNGAPSLPHAPDGFGLYSASSYGLTTEGNTFSDFPSLYTKGSIGTYIENADYAGSGINNYRNDYNNLAVGTQVVGSNQQLQIDCNRFYKATDSYTDIHLAYLGNLGQQGQCNGTNPDPKLAQANEFHGTCNGSTNTQVLNNGDHFEYDSYPQSAVGFNSSCVSGDVNAISCSGPTTPPYDRTLACPATSAVVGDFLKRIKLVDVEINNTLNQIINLTKGLIPLPSLVSSEVATLQRTVNMLINTRQQDANAAVTQYLLDNNVIGAKAVLSGLNTNAGNAGLMSIMAAENAAQTNSLLQSIDSYASSILPTQPVLAADWKAYTQFYRMLIPIKNRPGGYRSITNEERVILQNVAQAQHPTAVVAQAILDAVDKKAVVLHAKPLYLGNNHRDGSFGEQDQLNKNVLLVGNSKQEAKIYPNPTQNQVTIELPGNQATDNMYLRLMDMAGKVIIGQNISATQTTLNINQLNSGLYFINLTNTQGYEYHTKLVVQ